jgi:hypothetical protein
MLSSVPCQIATLFETGLELTANGAATADQMTIANTVDACSRAE